MFESLKNSNNVANVASFIMIFSSIINQVPTDSITPDIQSQRLELKQPLSLLELKQSPMLPAGQ